MKLTDKISLVGSGQYGISSDEDCSVYLINGGSELGLIDSGAGLEVERIIRNVQKDGYNPENIGKVILTHSHADHVGGAEDLRNRFNLEVLAPEGAAGLIESGSDEELGLDFAKRSGVYDQAYEYPHCSIDRTLDHGEKFLVGEKEIKTVKVPGHSPHSTCYLLEGEQENSLFTGDVVFFDGEIGLLNCPGSELAGYRKYFDRLLDLNFEGLFPGHKVFVLNGGKQHVETASDSLRQLTVPKTFF